jgi:hypothetical protein
MSAVRKRKPTVQETKTSTAGGHAPTLRLPPRPKLLMPWFGSQFW